jgi:hypothetical protein
MFALKGGEEDKRRGDRFFISGQFGDYHGRSLKGSAQSVKEGGNNENAQAV